MDDLIMALSYALFAQKHEAYYTKRQELQSVLQNRLAEIAARDEVRVGRQFYHRHNPAGISTITSITLQSGVIPRTFVYWNDNVQLYRTLEHFKELAAINGPWRMLPDLHH